MTHKFKFLSQFILISSIFFPYKKTTGAPLCQRLYTY